MKLRSGVLLLIFSLFTGTALLTAQDFPPPPPRPQKAPPAKDSENTFKYRGSRIYNENLPLKILQTKCARKEDGNVFLEIIFNQSINPRSMRPESILVNNLPVPKFSKFSFNRKGDTIKILVPMNSNSFKLKINQISSFDGKEIEQVELLVEVQDS